MIFLLGTANREASLDPSDRSQTMPQDGGAAGAKGGALHTHTHTHTHTHVSTLQTQCFFYPRRSHPNPGRESMGTSHRSRPLELERAYKQQTNTSKSLKQAKTPAEHLRRLPTHPTYFHPPAAPRHSAGAFSSPPPLPPQRPPPPARPPRCTPTPL